MTLQDFAREYKAMRELQKRFFRGRDMAPLDRRELVAKSKAAEAALDRKATEILEASGDAPQKALF